MHFLADVMVAKLGRWLRILGIKTEITKERDDHAILIEAREKGLTLITMDWELAQKANKIGVDVVVIPYDYDMPRQIATILKKYSIPIEGFEERTLCTKCNGSLRTVTSKDAAGKIPEDITKRFAKLWQCTECGQFYWEGSHWKKINEMIEKVKVCLASM